MMYSNILSLICTVSILLISCAARVVVRDTAPDMVVSGALWAPSIHDKIIPSKVRAVGREVAEAQITPAKGALWEPNAHEKVLPSPGRAVDGRANIPRETPISGLLWQGAVHEELAARQPAVRRADTDGGGFLFESAVHQQISDS
ncbi:hypothetical protein DFH29DRAFT_932999 [Suillus ampliporus]|nr:hypothetical protein DFH29DRAFT_932999 [Suillus ampliporus]